VFNGSHKWACEIPMLEHMSDQEIIDRFGSCPDGKGKQTGTWQLSGDTLDVFIEFDPWSKSGSHSSEPIKRTTYRISKVDPNQMVVNEGQISYHYNRRTKSNR